MERYNIFQNEHRGLMSLLNEVTAGIEKKDFSNNKIIEDTRNKIREMVLLISEHQQKDENILLALWELEPGVVDIVKKEQKHMMGLGDTLLNMCSMSQAFSTAEKQTSLSTLFHEFCNASVQLMKRKEELLNGLLWRYYSDVHLADWYRQAHEATTTKGKESRRNMHYLSNKDIVSWLKCTSEGATEKTFHWLLSMAKNELPDHRFHIIMQLLSEELKLA